MLGIRKKMRARSVTILIWSALYLPLASMSTDAVESERITHGHNVRPRNKFPMMVSLNTGLFGCGGTILNRRWMITAAACATLRRMKLQDVRITAGDYSELEYDGTEQVVGAVEVRIHDAALLIRLTPKHLWPFGFPNNIALVRVHPPFVLNRYVSPISFPDAKYAVEKNSGEAYIIGWGLLDGFSLFRDERLQETKVILRELDECQDLFVGYLVTDAHICAGKHEGPGACLGDEGGPLLLYERNSDGFTQIGLFSYTTSFPGGGPINLCGLTPDLFINLGPYLEWMKQQVHHLCQRQDVHWCYYRCEEPSLYCDQLAANKWRKAVVTELGSFNGICVNRTIAIYCQN